MGTRAVLVGIAVAAILLGPGAGVGAGESKTCTFYGFFTIAPGLSATPNSGTFTSGGEHGEITCEGETGSFGAEGRYGTADPDGCLTSGEGDGVHSWTMGQGSARRHVTNPFTFTYGLMAAGGVISGRFEGPRLSGTFEVTPTKGDCFTAPVTEVTLRAKGTMRG